MPIKIPNDLPAFEKLQQEGVRLIGENEALRQDVRPMQVALLNLMPEKPKTEMQLARLLGATPLQVELTLLTTSSYRPNTVPLSHLQSFYRTWEDVQERKFDGLIITGAPVEMLPFEEVKYWPELTRILDWSRTHAQLFPHLLGAQAASSTSTACPSTRCRPSASACSATMSASGSTSTARPDARLRRLFRCRSRVTPRSAPPTCRSRGGPRGAGHLERGGLCLLQEPEYRTVYMFNHLEYDTYTLHDEFCRDRASRADVCLPFNYYPDDDPEKAPRNCWRAYAHLLFGNWINEMYQTTPYEPRASAVRHRLTRPEGRAPGTSSHRRARHQAAEHGPGRLFSSSTCR